MKGQERIDEMFAFIVVDTDGTEGVPAIQTPTGAMPLMGADMARVESIRPFAEGMAKCGLKVTLAKFSVREDLEVIE